MARTPSGRNKDQSPPEPGSALPFSRGPSTVPPSTYTAPRPAPDGMSPTVCTRVKNSRISKQNSSFASAGAETSENTGARAGGGSVMGSVLPGGLIRLQQPGP